MLSETTEVAGQPLVGVRILVIEDEYFIADDVKRVLESAGATVVGPAATMAKANEAIDRDMFDCAILDLNLHGEDAVPLGDRLIAAGHSFAIATGYGGPSIPDRLQGVPRIEKPFDPPAILDLVQQLSCAKSTA